ncbi:Zinc/iron permease [Basidiobolus meristosporus CBS 931.73]|uniref:Zinc/iron permease n=1 Tax=Basidiobolus meristosporus CBS 931.73 TaxID=1314790 RepID=A0A1Y1Y8B7_9FUNG|nr:Zinc/iron permease [Basidiobolus meristosporus CBS 931.73]|eukprot:ORX93986.1 Zinc/iron permease [Basidiobolus meristosporus CBS 931.73]
MDAFLWLCLLCLAMFAGSFVAGSIPLSFRLSEDKLKILTAFGAGLLIGTALIVIIPEGVETIYSINEAPSTTGFEIPQTTSLAATSLEKRFESLVSRDLNPKDIGEPYSEILPTEVHINPHKHIGAALALGFAFMLVVEQFGTHKHPQSTHVSLTDFSEMSEPLPPVKQKSTATIGLIVHAAADGIALGAASASQQPSLEFLVFIAIMLHKSTSAFGLTAFLLSEGRARNVVRKHLLVFSLAAPVGAILTYLLINARPADSITTQLWTGVVLLFSAGTFLFVAVVHSLGEIYKTSTAGHSDSSLGLVQVLCIMAGIFFPLLISIDHGH